MPGNVLAMSLVPLLPAVLEECPASFSHWVIDCRVGRGVMGGGRGGGGEGDGLLLPMAHLQPLLISCSETATTCFPKLFPCRKPIGFSTRGSSSDVASQRVRSASSEPGKPCWSLGRKPTSKNRRARLGRTTGQPSANHDRGAHATNKATNVQRGC